MDNDKTIKEFKKSLLLEGYNRFPGMVYSAGVRIDQLSESQLYFQKEILNRYKNNFIDEETRTTNESDFDYAIFCINEEINIRKSALNSVKWDYIAAPYFTVQEINSLLEDGSMISDRHHLVQDGEIVNSTNYGQKIKKLEDELRNTNDPDEIASIKQTLISLGWNPEVEYSTENAIKAKNRIERIYTKEMNEYCTFIDLHDDIKSCTNIVFNENYEEYPYKAIYISIYENGNVRIDDKPIIHEEFKNTPEMYRIFLDESIGSEVIKYKELFEESHIESDVLFSLPMNYNCYTIVKHICEAYNLIERPIIARVFDSSSGIDPDLNIIESFTKFCARNNNDTFDIACDSWKIFTSANVIR